MHDLVFCVIFRCDTRVSAVSIVNTSKPHLSARAGLIPALPARARLCRSPLRKKAVRSVQTSAWVMLAHSHLCRLCPPHQSCTALKQLFDTTQQYHTVGVVQFNFGKPKVPGKVARETVIPEPSYSLPIALAGLRLSTPDEPGGLCRCYASLPLH